MTGPFLLSGGASAVKRPTRRMGTADWFRILQMLPMGKGGPQPSREKKRLFGMDMPRTKMQGLFGTYGVPPWG